MVARGHYEHFQVFGVYYNLKSELTEHKTSLLQRKS